MTQADFANLEHSSQFAELPADALARIAALKASDRKLAPWVDRIGPISLPKPQRFSLLDALARSILFQQLNGKAAETILARLLALCEQKILTAEKLASLSVDAYRSVGVSNNKALALGSLAQFALDGRLPTPKELGVMDNAQIVEHLIPIRGIGAWTVQMLLIFRMGRPDVWPVDDFGVRKGVQIAHKLPELPNAKAVTAMAARRWKPNYSLAALYFWRVADAAKLMEGKAKSVPTKRAKPAKNEGFEETSS
jgi:DNA-3-methyladenine glycosylase II